MLAHFCLSDIESSIDVYAIINPAVQVNIAEYPICGCCKNPRVEIFGFSIESMIMFVSYLTGHPAELNSSNIDEFATICEVFGLEPNASIFDAIGLHAFAGTV